MPIYKLRMIRTNPKPSPAMLREAMQAGKPYTLVPNDGFTLLETLISVTILVTGILTPLGLASQAIRFASFSQHQIIASYLAQEGIEFVRNTRDNNFLQGNNWIGGNSLNNCSDIPPPQKSCYFDAISNTITVCSGACPTIKYNTVDKYYTYTTGGSNINTPFTRTVTITSVSGNSDEVTVRVVVSWPERFAQESFAVQENIFNWRK